MNSKDSFIGIFDSGVGGLTVLAEARKLIPEQSFLYFADRKHAPYGEGSRDQTRQFTFDSVEFMATFGLRALVLACNTATSAAVKELRNRFDFPIIGMEPAVKPAVENGKGKVLVLATPLTLREEKFRKLVQQVDKQGKVDGIGMPMLVRYAENGTFKGNQVTDYLTKQFDQVSWDEYSAIVLGCTHFIYFKAALRSILPDHIAIIDGNEGTVRRLIDQVGPGISEDVNDRFFDSEKDVKSTYFDRWLDYLKAND